MLTLTFSKKIFLEKEGYEQLTKILKKECGHYDTIHIEKQNIINDVYEVLILDKSEFVELSTVGWYQNINNNLLDLWKYTNPQTQFKFKIKFFKKN